MFKDIRTPTNGCANYRFYSDKEPTYATKQIVDCIFNTSFKNYFLRTTEEFFAKINSRKWNIINCEEKKNILNNYIPVRIRECENSLKKMGLSWFTLDELCEKVISLDKKAIKLVLCMIYYLSFLNDDIDNDIMRAYAKKMGTITIRINENLLIPFNYSVKCPSCNSDHYINKLNRDFTYDTSKSCINCQHNIRFDDYYKFDDYSFYCNLCNCSSCKNIFKEYVAVSDSIRLDWSRQALEDTSKIINKLAPEYKFEHTDKELKNYYIINRNSLDKTTRLILSLNPRTKKDLYTIIDQLREDIYHKNIKREYFLNNLKNKKILVPIKTLVGTDDDINSLKVAIDKFIIHCTQWYGIVIFSQLRKPWKDSQASSSNKYIYNIVEFEKKSFDLNPYFINHIESTSIIPDFKHNLLKSNAEKCQFSSLIQKYPNNIVIPNYPLRQLFNINSIASHFNKDEVSYLWRCIVDFVVITEDGYILKVVELQKGKHHDDIDWIEKDNLKRKALSIAGITFEETY